ncbi:hypothetical protein Kpho01_38910 [Kitasatospora phosalacinea]|uniref:Uncharacterized protein n=1 Tax=Kitasatospora phosalacinea TaxID=2065 RepID=A0A9W6PGW0_9ACTN|nr:hypothetical protein Kpho01_38910 [Kitasatospora phosalacinea]
MAAVALSGSDSSRDSVVQMLTRLTLRPEGPPGRGGAPTEGGRRAGYAEAACWQLTFSWGSLEVLPARWG